MASTQTAQKVSVVPNLASSAATSSASLPARPAIAEVAPESLATTLRVATQTALVTLLLTGLGYPLVMTALAGTFFHAEAKGSLVANAKGDVVGSRLIGQAFSRPEYFQPRPSAAGAGYDAAASSGSNLGPSSAKLRDRVKADAERLRKENPDASPLIPAELVTASGSGLDPHLSPAGARWQVARVAKARGVSRERVDKLLEDNIEGRDLGFLGESRINVLELNLALDRQFGKAH
jgi:K+-transporting ATPase ATPase C chain